MYKSREHLEYYIKTTLRSPSVVVAHRGHTGDKPPAVTQLVGRVSNREGLDLISRETTASLYFLFSVSFCPESPTLASCPLLIHILFDFWVVCMAFSLLE